MKDINNDIHDLKSDNGTNKEDIAELQMDSNDNKNSSEKARQNMDQLKTYVDETKTIFQKSSKPMKARH
jgi:hypothetical protein